MKDFFSFMFGEIPISSSSSIYQNIIISLAGYFKVLFIYIIFAVILAFVFKIETSDSTPIAMKRMENLNFYMRIIFICMLGPIIEELIFRLPLYVTKINLWIALSLFCVVLFGLLKKNIQGVEIGYMIVGVITFAIAGWLFVYYKYEFISESIKNNYLLWMHFLTIVFCLVHFWNHNFSKNMGTSVILMFMALWSGYYLSFIRLKFGLGYSILLHCFHNTLVSLPFIIKTLIK